MQESNRNALERKFIFPLKLFFRLRRALWCGFTSGPLWSTQRRQVISTNQVQTRKYQDYRKRPILSNSWFTEELGLADDYSARVEIEVDSPGPSHVIQSIPLKARSGTARVHAPKDLQVLKTHSKALDFEKYVFIYAAYIRFNNKLPSSFLEVLFLAFAQLAVRCSLCFCLDNQPGGSTG